MLRPSMLLLIALIVYAVNLILGPYAFLYPSVDALLYLAVCFAALWLGLFLAEEKQNATWSLHHFELTREAEWRLGVIMFVSLLASLAVIYYQFYVSGVDYGEGLGSVRWQFSRRREMELEITDPFWSKLSEAVGNGGAASFLVVAALSRLHFRTTGLLALLALIGPGAFNILQGARAGATYAVFLLFITVLVRRNRGLTKLPEMHMRAVVPVAVVAAVFFIVQLFILRAGVQDASDMNIEEMWLVQEGDAVLRPAYRALNGMVGGMLSPLYSISVYFSHSFAFFSHLFMDSNYQNIYFGGLEFRILGFLLRPLGVPFPNYIEIVLSQPYYGHYPTFAQGFLLDWGLLLTPLITLFHGLFVGWLHRKAISGNFWGITVYPVFAVMILVSTFYYFPHWGGADFVLLFLFGLMLLLKGCIKHVSPPINA